MQEIILLFWTETGRRTPDTKKSKIIVGITYSRSKVSWAESFQWGMHK